MDNEWSELTKEDVTWCVKRLPAPIKELCKEKQVVVAGGFIRSCITREEVSDIDLFTTSKELAKQLAEELRQEDDPKLWETDNAYSLNSKRFPFPVQFIHRWVFEKPEQIVPSFDFTIARAAIWWNANSNSWQSMCSSSFYSDLAAKRLVYCSPERNEDAGGSIIRVLKFYQKGYRIPLNSLAAVISRLVQAVDFEKYQPAIPGTGLDDETREQWTTKILTGLLYEVDPNSVVPIHYED